MSFRGFKEMIFGVPKDETPRHPDGTPKTAEEIQKEVSQTIQEMKEQSEQEGQAPSSEEK